MECTLGSKQDARLRNLDYLFNPRSIAFVGATETPGKWGFIIFNNLLVGGYDGRIYPVNPSRNSVLGYKVYPSVRDIPDEVDLAVFTVPARQVAGAMEDCVSKGVKVALVISAGFKELGPEGALLEKEMVDRARAGGIILVGPNGQGICCPRNRLFSWMPLFFPPPGNIGLISQSGNILNMLIGEVYHCGLGISKAVSSGNEADLKMEDYLQYLADDEETRAIVSYIEGVSDGRGFFHRAKEVASRKPVVVLKGGRSRFGVAAARSHTGAMAVSDRLFEAASKQAGLVRARTIEEAGVLASSFINRPLPRGRRVGIITGGGGLGVIASDVCAGEGLEVARLSDGTLKKIGNLLPDWWVPGNPVDLVAGLDFSVIKPVVEILMESGEVDAIIFIWIASLRDSEVRTTPFMERGLDLREGWDETMLGLLSHLRELNRPMRDLGVPFYFVTNLTRKELGGSASGLLEEGEIIIYPTVELACRAISEMANYFRCRAHG